MVFRHAEQQQPALYCPYLSACRHLSSRSGTLRVRYHLSCMILNMSVALGLFNVLTRCHLLDLRPQQLHDTSS